MLNELVDSAELVYRQTCHVCGAIEENFDIDRLADMCDLAGWTADRGTAICGQCQPEDVKDGYNVRTDLAYDRMKEAA